MNHFINDISIRNFKSIRECEIPNCKRINLFIGRPNVGKSNIIEALSLFSISFLRENSSKKLPQLIRIQNEAELFYEGNWDFQTYVETDFGRCDLLYNPQVGLQVILEMKGEMYGGKVNDTLNVSAWMHKEFETNIKRYQFNTNVVYKKGHARYLIPPYGTNLLSIIENYPELKKDVTRFFSDYNLEIAFDQSSQTIKILKKKDDGIFLIPYNSVADTLQRIIFFKAAIASNQDSVLLFEEPEAHSFPPYMAHLTQEMIASKSNQFFIATHSPFILNDLLENAREELAIFNVDFKDKQTVVKRLSDKDLHEVYQYGVDLFTNNESYL